MENNSKKNWLLKSTFLDSIFVALCSAGLLAYSLYHHHFDRNTSEWKMSPYLFPTLISVFGFLLAVSLFADAWHDFKTPGALAPEEGGGRHNLAGALVLIGASIVYYILLPILRFIPATILFLLGLFIYLGERKWWKLALLSGITTAAIYILFGVSLNVRLP